MFLEPFVDFGMLELLAALGLAALARRVYLHRPAGLVLIGMSIAAPVMMLVCPRGWIRGLAIANLAISLINVSILAAVVQTGNVPELQLPRAWQTRLRSWHSIKESTQRMWNRSRN